MQNWALFCMQEDVKDVQREVQVLKLVGKHENVAELISVHEDSAYVHLVLELCEGGELFDRVIAKGTFTEKMAAGQSSYFQNAPTRSQNLLLNIGSPSFRVLCQISSSQNRCTSIHTQNRNGKRTGTSNSCFSYSSTHVITHPILDWCGTNIKAPYQIFRLLYLTILLRCSATVSLLWCVKQSQAYVLHGFWCSLSIYRIYRRT